MSGTALSRNDRFRVMSVSDFDPDLPGFRRRIKYPKTRAGCEMCKLKKVKCDEVKPVCSRCRRNHRVCQYHIPNAIVQVPSPPEDGISNPGTQDARLLHHCRIHWAEIFPGFDQNHNFLWAFKSSPLVRGVCHAIAASHLRHLQPGHRPHIIAEYSQRALALQEYRQQLGLSARDLGQAGVNAMLLGATLFGLLAFPLSPVNSHNTHGVSAAPWVSPDHEAEMGWLTFQAGLGPLMKSVLVYLPRAFEFLATIFTPQRDGRMWPNFVLQPPDVPKTWMRFFGLDDNGDEHPQSPKSLSSVHIDSPPPLASSVHLLVRTTAFLRALEPTQANGVLYLVFMFKAQRDFRALLLREDPRAWWLYGYWAGLMCRFPGLWWCRERASRQYDAVRGWLSSLHLGADENGELWAEMMAELDAAATFPPRKVEMEMISGTDR